MQQVKKQGSFQKAIISLAAVCLFALFLYTPGYITLQGVRQDTLLTSGLQSDILETEVKVTPKVSKILVAAYWRAGSSFLGEFFNQNSESFYLYEPSNGYFYPTIHHSVELERNNSTGLLEYVKTYSNQYATLKKSTLRRESKFAETLVNLLNCRFDEVPQDIFSQRFMMQSKNLYHFHFCMEFDPARVAFCRNLLYPTCRSAGIRAIKEVWLRLKTAEIALKLDNDLKVIHLMRDPRASALSLQGSVFTDDANEDTMVERAEEECRKKYQDMIRIKRLLLEYPGRFLSLRYEDITREPLNYSEKIYSFLGQSVPVELKKWLKEATSGAVKEYAKNYQFNTVTGNSTFVSSAWRKKIGYQLMDDMQNSYACREVLALAGYHLVHNEEELRNTDIPLYSGKYIGENG